MNVFFKNIAKKGENYMWGQIIQAIDHAAQRINDGAGAGLKLAGNSKIASNSGNSTLGSDIKSAVDAIKSSKTNDNEFEIGGKTTSDLAEIADNVKDEQVSDEQLKNESVFNDDIIDLFSKINAYDFAYTDKAKDLYLGNKGVDNDEHVGVMAQELQQNPITDSTVAKDENGYLSIDTKELTMADTAVLSDVCKRLLQIEERLNKLEAK